MAEYLMDHFGYGGGMEFDAFRDQVSKTVGYLKSKGDLTGEDRPQPKGKPLRYWSMAESQSEEMASDVAEIEATDKESLTVADVKLIETLDSLDTAREVEERKAVAETPETYMNTWTNPPALEFKAKNKTPLGVRQILDGFENSGESFQGDLCDFRLFAAGVAFAEKHHGIG